jgi:ParB family chromosome partitioning protein
VNGSKPSSATVVELPVRGPGLLDRLSRSSLDVLVRSIPLDAIEADPDQPRVHFDQAELEQLAASLRENGLLQEPAVYPIALDADGLPSRFRLLFGERRWRAARLAGWTAISCKVVPSSEDGDLIAKLKRVDQQEAENRDRAALSAIEEGKALRVKLDVLRRLDPQASERSLQEKVAAERKVSHTTVFRLVNLLKGPEVLQTAILERKITSRDVAFRLVEFWADLLRQHQSEAKAKRELLFRDGVRAWAEQKGLEELNAETLTRYATEHHLDAKVVKADVRTAEKIEGKAQEAFAKLVERAVREGWTAKDARRLLSGRSGRKDVVKAIGLYERNDTKGKARLTVHLERLDDPVVATPEALRELAVVLRELLARVEREPVEAPSASS